ncbi:MAG: (2Fe-2S)-binding protein, partial [Burkholderiales bacterium]|nr:(2Fe-2S)-binding protein [Burkholderiales bacterium]
MSGYRLEAPAGRWIDRERTFVFRFGGRDIPACAGDTVAAALLAAGIRVVARSVKLHRPRGVFSCGVEEPSALLDVGVGAARTPNTRATDIDAAPGLSAVTGNAWPSLRLDLAAVNDRLASLLPAGFYYKTFMGPKAVGNTLWTKVFEPIVRQAAGLGARTTEPDPDRYAQFYTHCDVLICGAGPAGIAAALAAGQSGKDVILCDEQAELGGSLLHEATAGI